MIKLYKIYTLCRFGISPKHVRLLVDEGLELEDFMEGSECIDYLKKKKPKLFRDIMETVPQVDIDSVEDDIYQLVEGGLSLTIIKNLAEHDIDYSTLIDLSSDELSDVLNRNAKAIHTKVMRAYEDVEKKKKSIPFPVIKKVAIQEVNNLKFGESITVLSLRNKLSARFGFREIQSLFKDLLQELFEGNYIRYNSIGITKYTVSLLDVLEDIPDKELLIKRFSNCSFQEIGDHVGLSKQGAKNRVDRALGDIPRVVEEEKYEEIFTLCDIPEDLFTFLFEEDKIVYGFLNTRLNKGTSTVVDKLYDFPLTEEQREIIMDYYSLFVSNDGEFRHINKTNVLSEILPMYAKNRIKVDELADKYNEYIKQKGLPETILADKNSFRGMIERSENVINGSNHYVRFYDCSVLTDEHKAELNEIINLETGIYSTNKIFRDNLDFMGVIQIHRADELHNLLKRYCTLENIEFTRMPEFSVGNITKKDFIINKIRELGPIYIFEFLQYVEDHYGLRQDSLHSFICSELEHYIDNNVLKVDFSQLIDEQIKTLSSKINEPIYTTEQFKKIFLQIAPDIESKHFNKYNLSKLGYVIRSNYVLSDEFQSVDDYFTKLILSQDYYEPERSPLYANSTYFSTISKLERNFDIIKVESDMYITSKKLKSAGVYYEDFYDFQQKVLEYLLPEEFFTLHMLRDKGFEHYLEDFGFEDLFYERVISKFDGIQTIRLGEGYVFIQSEDRVTLSDFFASVIEYKNVIGLYDLIEHLAGKYGLYFEESKVINSIRGIEETTIYYSEELYRFFADKQDYYEEVYSNDY